MLKILALGLVVSGTFAGTMAAAQAGDYMVWGYTFTTGNENAPTAGVAPTQPSNFNALATPEHHRMRLQRLRQFEQR